MSNETDKTVTHPMEYFLNIEEGSTPLVTIEQRSTELVIAPEFDEKDKEIEEQFQEVYDAAMTVFETQCQGFELIESQYRARSQEVAAQFLNTALAAAKEKSNMKQHADKLAILKVKASTPNTVNQNLIVADRNELLKRIMGKTNETE